MINPFAKFSPRTIRIIYAFWTLTVLCICLINFWVQMVNRVVGNDQCRWIEKGESRLLITEIVSGGVAEQAGIKDGDYLVKINGEFFKRAIDAQAIINKFSGAYVTYTIERGSYSFDTKILILRSINLAFLSQSLFGLGFLVVGFVVVMAKPIGKIQRMFANFSILSMLFFGLTSLNLNPATEPMWRISLLGLGFIIASIFAPISFVRFFMFFPVKRKAHDKLWLNGLLFGLSSLLTIAILYFSRFQEYMFFTALFYFSRYGFLFAGFAIFTESYFKYAPKERLPQLKPVLIAVCIGIILFGYGLAVQTINPFAAFLNPIILLPITLLFLVPMFFGYAIFRYRLMDIDIVIRRSLIYGTVTASLAAIYLVSVYGIGSLLNYFFGTQDNELLVVLSLIAIAFIFDPIKQRMQVGVDKLFFHERYDYQKALLDFTQELPRLMELEQILNSIINRISTTMHIEKINIFICKGSEECKSVTKNIDEEYFQFSDGEYSLIALLKSVRRPVDLHLLSDEFDTLNIKDEEKRQLIHAGIKLSVPMFLKDRLIGIINVGQKKSGKIFSQEDINLLATVAGQAAIAIENARLHKYEIERQRVKEELELAKKIQQGLFPKSNPQLPGLEISGISIPASSVGGDYYDFIKLSDQKILVVVADVAGKGMSAALYMSKIQGMVHLAAHMYSTPKDMLININKRIFEGLDRKSFITMIIALFDLKKKVVQICRAGHNRALICINKKVKAIKGGGIGLGLERGELFEDAIEEIKIPIKLNALYLFYTDGITEAMNENNDQLGEQTIVNILKSKFNFTAQRIQKEILNSVEKFRGSAEQRDDITMIVVKSISTKSEK